MNLQSKSVVLALGPYLNKFCKENFGIQFPLVNEIHARVLLFSFLSFLFFLSFFDSSKLTHNLKVGSHSRSSWRIPSNFTLFPLEYTNRVIFFSRGKIIT